MTAGNTLDEQIANGRALVASGHHDAVIAYFRQLCTQHPRDARVHRELAFAYDRSDHEEQALSHYQEAIRLGLTDEENLRGTMLGLGSTLRNVGQVDEAVQVLADACERYPDYRPMRVFLALALYSSRKRRRAIIELLEVALSCDLDGYERAIREYTDDLSSRE